MQYLLRAGLLPYLSNTKNFLISLSILMTPFISFLIFSPSWSVNTYYKYVNIITFPICNALCQAVGMDLILKCLVV